MNSSTSPSGSGNAPAAGSASPPNPAAPAGTSHPTTAGTGAAPPIRPPAPPSGGAHPAPSAPNPASSPAPASGSTSSGAPSRWRRRVTWAIGCAIVLLILIGIYVLFFTGDSPKKADVANANAQVPGTNAQTQPGTNVTPPQSNAAAPVTNPPGAGTPAPSAPQITQTTRTDDVVVTQSGSPKATLEVVDGFYLKWTGEGNPPTEAFKRAGLLTAAAQAQRLAQQDESQARLLDKFDQLIEGNQELRRVLKANAKKSSGATQTALDEINAKLRQLQEERATIVQERTVQVRQQPQGSCQPICPPGTTYVGGGR